MKTCPICQARCFDDMEVCYGCMHRFDVADDAAKPPAQYESVARDAQITAPIPRCLDNENTSDARVCPDQYRNSVQPVELYPGYQLVISLVPRPELAREQRVVERA